MAERLTFTLTGRDELSRVLNNTANNADRLRLRLSGITADSDGQLRDLQGRFLSVADAQARLSDRTLGTQDAFRRLRDAGDEVGKSLRANLISLAPAAIPAVAGLASSATVLGGQLGAVAVAAGAYALALGPQIGRIGEAAEAQEKYQEAVAASGRGSQEAIKAQQEYQRKLAAMPPATREAAVAVGLLKDSYADWSDSLAGDVMAPFTKGVAVANELLPQTTGLVKGASSQFDRLITLVAGGIASPGFDALNNRFTTFANDTMRGAVDSLTVFLAKLDAGAYDGSGVSQWMDYAAAQGPLVWDTLENIGQALLHVLEAGSGVGVGMLEVVNVLSAIVSSVPPDAIATLLQLAIAIKATKLAAAGASAAQAGIAAFGLQIASMRTAAAGAPGALAGTTAAIGGLSRTAKVAMAGTGIGLLLITLDALSSKSQKPRPDVDKLTTSLTELGRSGKVSGEALRVYGADLGGLSDALDTLADPSGLDKTQQFLTGLIGMDSTPVKNAKEAFDGIDEALASMVSAGNADQAAAALDMVITQMERQGHSAKDVRAQLGDYKDALAAQALEQQLAAESMGIFGDQAIVVQQQLDAQKQSAEGLRQSIIALNDANRSAYDSQIQFEASIDALSESFEKNGATLNLTTEAGRANGQAMSAAAKAHDEMIASGLAAGESLGSMTKKSDALRAEMLRLAEATGMSDSEAREYVNTLLGVPGDIKTAVKLEREQAITGLQEVQAEINQTPDAKSVKVSTLNASAIAALEAVGLKTKQLPDGRTEVFTKNGQSLGAVADVRAAINSLRGKTVTVSGKDRASSTARAVQAAIDKVRSKQVTITARYRTIGIEGTAARNAAKLAGFAQGGPVGHYADGGDIVQLIPFGGAVFGPGTGTSDSIPAWLSHGEYVIKAAAVDRYGIALFDALNAERFAGGGFAGGGETYSASRAQISLSTVSTWYDQDVQRLKDAWTELNQALRDQAKHSTKATRAAVADARAAVNAADKALGLKSGSKVSGFSLTGYAKNLEDAVKASNSWEKNLQKIGNRAGADIEETLRGMGESGRSLVAALAKASNKEFNSIVDNLRKLGPTAAATLADYTKQLSTSTSSSKKFQADLLKLAASGYGDLAMQLAGQGDADAMAIAAAAVKSPSAAKKANTAVKNNDKLLSTEELTAAAQMMGALSAKKNATVADVVAAGVSWPMLAYLAPLYAKQIKAIPGTGKFVTDMKERGIKLAGGGLLVGAGTGTSDSIPLWGSNGEYMIRAASVDYYGKQLFDALNAKTLAPGRTAAAPGLPAAQAATAAAVRQQPAVTYNVYPRKSVISIEDLRLLQRQEEARQRVGRPG
ncbi:hypothetical protein [Streptomyces sp. CRN 30]|uniref:hypothetical protein n=1 Tax=Streptomyces sp. CRN 30 TaxID=3075613 RepID=UPI002A7F94C5|nr:hypothetical protein [Streptomyces sp. CRN 30]